MNNGLNGIMRANIEEKYKVLGDLPLPVVILLSRSKNSKDKITLTLPIDYDVRLSCRLVSYKENNGYEHVEENISPCILKNREVQVELFNENNILKVQKIEFRYNEKVLCETDYFIKISNPVMIENALEKMILFYHFFYYKFGGENREQMRLNLVELFHICHSLPFKKNKNDQYVVQKNKTKDSLFLETDFKELEEISNYFNDMDSFNKILKKFFVTRKIIRNFHQLWNSGYIFGIHDRNFANEHLTEDGTFLIRIRFKKNLLAINLKHKGKIDLIKLTKKNTNSIEALSKILSLPKYKKILRYKYFQNNNFLFMPCEMDLLFQQNLLIKCVPKREEYISALYDDEECNDNNQNYGYFNNQNSYLNNNQNHSYLNNQNYGYTNNQNYTTNNQNYSYFNNNLNYGYTNNQNLNNPNNQNYGYTNNQNYGYTNNQQNIEQMKKWLNEGQNLINYFTNNNQ
jgi:hypothetical protein